ncbi:MAG: FAD-dependent oxidoreductase [Pseudanabaenaceae cyanobacterium bins.68]|nr:FAD-dependent oxidoreductase [Pseudanabaenaceae cyanobacterium bins.68]
MKVIIIGAGLAGLICATTLRRQGFEVEVLEKSAGVGGRMARRRLSGTQVDHGAQYISPKGIDFQRFIHKMESLGVVRPWVDQIYDLTAAGLRGSELIYPRYCGSSGMNAIAKYLAEGLTLRLNTRVVAASYDLRKVQWQLTTDQGEIMVADRVVSAIPAPQFLTIFGQPLAELTDFIKAIAAVKFDANLTVMAGYHPSLVVPPEWRAIRCVDHSALGWIACDSSKYDQSPPTFVFQSTAAFAGQYLEDPDLAKQGRILLDQVGQLLDPRLAQPQWWQVQRWRYSMAREFLGVACLVTKLPVPLVCAGDWCAGNNVEAAYRSGLAAAAAIAELSS